jgi:ribosome assembly protein 1
LNVAILTVSFVLQLKPIVRVAVEPQRAGDLAKVQQALRVMYRSDPGLEVLVQETGEMVMVGLGELHIERCLRELAERSGVLITHSPPLVSFREGISCEGEPNKDAVVTVELPNKQCSLVVRAMPLPTAVVLFLESKADVIRTLRTPGNEDAMADFREELEQCLKAEGSPWDQICANIWSFGPRKCGANILFTRVEGLQHCNFWSQEQSAAGDDASIFTIAENAVEAGFQLATAAGPMCEEQMWGTAFCLEALEDSRQAASEVAADVEAVSLDDIAVGAGEESSAGGIAESFGGLSGQMISAARSACRNSFSKSKVRLVQAIYQCEMQCDQTSVGKLYGVLSKRRGRVVDEDLLEGTTIFIVKSHLPVAESFGFANEVFSKSSGAASSPQLAFSHWELIEDDPFFQPKTQEEREDHGEVIYETNYVREYINAIRKRKGLSTDEKVVAHAEKQSSRKR